MLLGDLVLVRFLSSRESCASCPQKDLPRPGRQLAPAAGGHGSARRLCAGLRRCRGRCQPLHKHGNARAPLAFVFPLFRRGLYRRRATQAFAARGSEHGAMSQMRETEGRRSRSSLSVPFLLDSRAMPRWRCQRPCCCHRASSCSWKPLADQRLERCWAVCRSSEREILRYISLVRRT